MAEIKLLDEQGNALEFSADERAAVASVKLEAARWASANSLQTLTFQMQKGSVRQLGVQFDNDPPLGSWVDVTVFTQGQTDLIESQLDFARGEHRRRLAGYSQFDH